MTVFEVYITNLGKYAEGQIVGETLKFPATTEEVQSLLKNIGVDGVRYEEFFITAFDGDVMGLYPMLGEPSDNSLHSSIGPHFPSAHLRRGTGYSAHGWDQTAVPSSGIYPHRRGAGIEREPVCCCV